MASTGEQGQTEDYALVHHHQARDFVSDFPDFEILLAKLGLELQESEPPVESEPEASPLMTVNNVVDELHQSPLVSAGRGRQVEQVLPGALPAP